MSILVKLVRSGEDGPEEYGFEARDGYHIERKHALNETELRDWIIAMGYTSIQMPFGEPITPCIVRVVSIDDGRRVLAMSQSQGNIYIVSGDGKTLDAYRAN